jgi:hypothetical protein
MHIKSLLLFLLTAFIVSCSIEDEMCETYDCRRNNMEIILDTSNLYVNKPANLIVNRKAIYLPKFRVFIGDSTFNYKSSNSETQQYFEGNDSTASTVLIFETSGEKVIKGNIVEYQTVSKDSEGQWVSTYNYPFEITLNVIEEADK